jgi:ATP-dependent RNA helicase DDX51/DBP6
MASKRKLKELEKDEPAPKVVPSYTDDEDSSDDDVAKGAADVDMPDADKVAIDPKYATFYKRFQVAASHIPLSSASADTQLYAEETEKAAPAEEQQQDDSLASQLKRKEEQVVPADLVPLPLPTRKQTTEGGGSDETTAPRLSKKRAAELAAIPKWLAEPTHVATETRVPFADLAGLSPRMRETLAKLDYKEAFAVQAAVLPALLEGVNSIAPDVRPDILVNAATGSGKTLAYSIPIIDALASRVVPRVRALVLLPTRPLIQQVAGVLKSLTKGTGLNLLTLGAERTFRDEQRLVVSLQPDIIVATPGRLVDHIRSQTPGFTLAYLQYLVVDEADRLLNQSYQEWAEVVIAAIETTTVSAPDYQPVYARWQRTVQKLIFSATLTRDPEKMAALRIRRPQIYVVGGGATADASVAANDRLEFSVPSTLTERLVSVRNASVKPLRLLQILLHAAEPITDYVLVFVKSNEAAARLARLLTLIDEQVFHRGLVIERCSGEVDPQQRRRTLQAFAAGKINVLVCTDLIARGVDISQIRHVFNYDLPPGRREYVHRVGRTARAGQPGTAWTLATDHNEHKYFWNAIGDRIFRENGRAVERVHEAELIEPEGTREYYRQEDGYKLALERLGTEVITKKID